MARENQGLQIALIIFVILTLLLGVTTYLFFRQYDEQYRKAQTATEEAANANNAARSAQTDLNTLKTILGFSTTETMDKITQDVKTEMDTYAADLDDSQKNYRSVVKHLFDTLQAKSATLVATEQRLRDAETKISQLEQSKAPLIAQQQNRADAAEQTLAQERLKFNQDLQSSVQARNDLQGRVDNLQQQAQEAQTQLASYKQQAETRLRTVSNLLKVRTEEIEQLKNPRLDSPDGRIQWVNQQLGTVWINLGEADGLTVGTTFAVFPGDTLNVADAQRKGAIEVTALRGPHLAEARIVDDVISNPLVPGDVVHTPIWSPGGRLAGRSGQHERQHYAGDRLCGARLRAAGGNGCRRHPSPIRLLETGRGISRGLDLAQGPAAANRIQTGIAGGAIRNRRQSRGFPRQAGRRRRS
ncbi:MAG: OmpH family outer membrane protein [Thermogutta sp.]